MTPRAEFVPGPAPTNTWFENLALGLKPMMAATCSSETF